MIRRIFFHQPNFSRHNAASQISAEFFDQPYNRMKKNQLTGLLITPPVSKIETRFRGYT